MGRTYCLLVSAVAGAAVLALEVLAARTMAPVLGSGSVTWAALLACALGMLAVGNVLGGFLSERAGPAGAVAWALAVTAAFLVVLSQSYGPLLRWAAAHSLIVSALLAAMVPQAVPLVMLGTITPVLLRHGQGGTGRWAGFVLAAGSGGGIAGALTAGILLVPGLGLTRSLLCIAVVLVLVAVPALWPERRWSAALVLLACLTSAAWCWQRPSAQPIVESFYGQLEVRTTDSARVLLIDGLPQTGLPEQVVPGDGLRHGYLLEAALLMRPGIEHALVVGLGAGLAPRLLAAHGIDCESVEIDPLVVEIARREFRFTGRATVADGRRFLERTATRYDLIVVDVCTADRLPWHIFTREAMELLRSRLVHGGVLAIQFIGDDGPWSASLLRTVEAVFGRSLMFSSVGDDSSVGPRWLFASRAVGLPSPDDPLSEHLPWTVIRPSSAGELLVDDHFAAELDWARTAAAWRGRYGSRARE